MTLTVPQNVHALVFENPSRQSHRLHLVIGLFAAGAGIFIGACVLLLQLLDLLLVVTKVSNGILSPMFTGALIGGSIPLIFCGAAYLDINKRVLVTSTGVTIEKVLGRKELRWQEISAIRETDRASIDGALREKFQAGYAVNPPVASSIELLNRRGKRTAIITGAFSDRAALLQALRDGIASPEL